MSSSPALRDARPDDAGAIASIYVEASSATLGAAANHEAIAAAAAGSHAMWGPLRRPRSGQWMLVLDDGGVCAFASCGVNDVRAHLYALYVRSDLWGSGIGSALLDVAATKVTEAGVTRWELWVQNENDRARAFYEARGWTFTGEQRANERGTFLLYAADL